MQKIKKLFWFILVKNNLSKRWYEEQKFYRKYCKVYP